MAISFLCSTARNLASAIQNSPSSPSSPADIPINVREDLKRLEKMLQRIEAVLEDAEAREIQDKSVRLWLRELKDLAYDAEDVLDEYHYELLRSQVEDTASNSDASECSSRRKRRKVCSLTLLPTNDDSSLESMADKIREIRVRFDEIANDRDALRLREDDGARRPEFSHAQPQTSSLMGASVVYGREDDREKLIAMLLSNEKGYQFSVTAIVGMGGVGKTTLAQLIYNDPRMHQHFDCMGWVCVSQNFDVARLTRDIIESITKKPWITQRHVLKQLDVLQIALKDHVAGKKVLLVLDDVWNENRRGWEILQAPFCNADRVRFIITTRNDAVAKSMQAAPPYRLGFLQKEHSRLLFWHHASTGPESREHSHLVGIGEQIVSKCGCLPLALKTIGCLLRYERDENRWMEILENDLWDLEGDEIFPALKISYRHMPAYLKPCFLYSSIFPKGFEFEKDQLIRMWMAQGYILPRGTKILEDIGSKYFDELQRRSFFQSPGVGYGSHFFDLIRYGRKELFVLHDTLHDLARSISNGEYSAMILKGGEMDLSIPKEVRHLYLVFANGQVNPKLLLFEEPRALRTLMVSGWHSSHSTLVLDRQLENLSCLRVLDLRQMKFPHSVGNLKHLRYISAEELQTGEMLAESVCYLYKLQTLALGSCPRLKELPPDIGNLVNLRHLLLKHINNFVVPPSFEKLTNLQTIAGLHVERNSRHYGGLGGLKNMVNLRQLHIRRLQNVVNIEDAREANLSSKKNLQILNLECYGNGGIDPIQAVLENFRPHAHLRELQLKGYHGARLPSWVGHSSFSKLVRIDIISCRCKVATSLGQLPFLRCLRIMCMYEVRYIGTEFCSDSFIREGNDIAFPSLEELVFDFLPNWEEWYELLDQDFPCLHTLTINNCRKLRKLPTLSVKQSLKIFNCGSLESITLYEIPALQVLFIKGLELTSPRLCKSAFLQVLEISDSQQVDLLPDEQQPLKLQTLYISGCRKLHSPWSCNLNSLSSLLLADCSFLKVSADERLPSTHHM